MKVMVTGGTGFIGQYVIHELLNSDVDIIVAGRDAKSAGERDWFDQVEFIQLDINKLSEQDLIQIGKVDKLIHLAWDKLPNYKGLFHFEENLMSQYLFLKKIIYSGVTDITVTGTCFEYGMKEGCLMPDMQTDPQNPYALAKDVLRRFLEQLQTNVDFSLKWIRLFYMYGKGQSEKSILSQLEKALDSGEKVFNMSGGEQIRDYLPVEEVARNIVFTALQNGYSGILNCCSGVPISIKTLVEDYLKENNRSIELNLGYYPYNDYEPMAFWGGNNNK